MSHGPAAIVAGAVILVLCVAALPFSSRIGEINRRVRGSVFPWRDRLPSDRDNFPVQGALIVGVVIGAGLLVLGVGRVLR